MHTQLLYKFRWLALVLTMPILTACGDESDTANSEPLIFNGDTVNAETQPEGETGVQMPDENPEGVVVDEAPSAPDNGLGDYELFGEELSDNVEFVQLETLLADPENYHNVLLQTEGTVRGVCQRRGCWMEMRSTDNPASESMTVKFVDYGFFVPLDSRSAVVRVQGTADVTALTAEQVEELLAEGYDPGVVREDGTAVLIRFMASGVRMWNRAD